jgi:hypothetical protein
MLRNRRLILFEISNEVLFELEYFLVDLRRTARVLDGGVDRIVHDAKKKAIFAEQLCFFQAEHDDLGIPDLVQMGPYIIFYHALQIFYLSDDRFIMAF